MRSLSVVVIFVSMALSGPAQAADLQCTVGLHLAGKEIWTLKIGPERIEGDNNVLTRKDQVVYGFVDGKPARFRFTEDRLVGRLTGTVASLHLERGEKHTRLSGILDRDRLVAEVSAEGMHLRDLSIRLDLKPMPDSSPDAPVTLVSRAGMVKLTFDGCDPSLAHSRPELLVMLHRLVLPRIMRFEDIPLHFRSDNNASDVYRRISSPPPPITPRPQYPR